MGACRLGTFAKCSSLKCLSSFHLSLVGGNFELGYCFAITIWHVDVHVTQSLYVEREREREGVNLAKAGPLSNMPTNPTRDASVGYREGCI